MAWFWYPDNNQGFNPGMMMPPNYSNPDAKELRKIASWIDQQMAVAKKKQQPKKPRVFTGLEAWGMTVLFGPIVLTTYYFAMKVLFIYGQHLINNFNALNP